jgi:SAM-dependent methyltransferase
MKDDRYGSHIAVEVFPLRIADENGGENRADAESYASAGVRASMLEYLYGCPGCRGTDLRHYCRVPSLFNPGEFIRYDRCRDCDLVFRNPRLPAAYRVHRYEEQVFPAEAKALRPKNQVHYRFMMQVIRRRVGPGRRRLLDFGCGAGGFLVEARAAGFDVMGLELNRDLARHVEREHGIPVHSGLVDEAAFAPERFDVIVSSQVFEHLVEPRATLRELAGHLRQPGLLLIEVPNLHDTRERLSRGAIMDDSHLFYFNKRSLGSMLGAEGFRVEQVHEGLRPYRVFGDGWKQLPIRPLRAVEQLFSALQLKTSLGVIASHS